MGEQQECALCGAVYVNRDKHQTWHDEIDAWIQVMELELGVRTRQRERPEGS